MRWIDPRGRPSGWIRLRILVCSLVIIATACGGGDTEALEERIAELENQLDDLDNTPDAIDPAPPDVDDTPSQDVVAVEVRRIEAGLGRLSPDGTHLAITRDSSSRLCVLELSSDEEVCPEEVFVPEFELRWSEDGSRLVYSTRTDLDIRILDVTSGQNRNITDDGLWDMASENLGNPAVVRDGSPTWLDSGTIAFFTLGADRSGLAIIGEDGSDLRVIEPPPRDDDRLQIFTWMPPLVTKGGKLLVGSMDGRIFEVDPTSEEITTWYDYADSYTGVVPNALVNPWLQPIAELPDGRILFFDQAVNTARGIGALSGGASAGAYVLDPKNGELIPLFAFSEAPNGWLGPISMALSPSGSRLLVTWHDGLRMDDAVNAPRMVLSLLDLERDSLPLDPRTLPVVWEPADFTSTTPGTFVWASNDTFALELAPQVVIFELAAGR